MDFDLSFLSSLLFVVEQQPLYEQSQRAHYDLARTMAAMSLGFIIVVTPWTLKEVIALSTGSKVN